MHNKPQTFADVTKLVMVRNSLNLFGKINLGGESNN